MPTNTPISSSTVNQSALDANTTSIRTLASSVNHSTNNDNSTASIATPIPASINTPIVTKPLFIKITSHTQNQTVTANKPLKISGISSDNINSNCTVYTDWNDQKPIQQATPTGPNGINDYSKWTFTYTSNYHLMTEGANELTSKLDCGAGQVKYYTVNLTGIYNQQPQLVGTMADNNKTISSSINRESPSSLPSNRMDDSSSNNKGSDADNSDNGDVLDEEETIGNNKGSDADNSDNGDVLDEEETIGNNNDLFDENDETEPSDEQIDDLFD